METFLPKGANKAQVRYLAVAAHKDDTEMLALEGILKGQGDEGSFVAVVLTDGGACPRGEDYKSVSDEDMAEIRTAEQKRAAECGHYHALYLLEHSSSDVKALKKEIVDEVREVLKKYPCLETIYLHNPFDRHPTHVATCRIALRALNELRVFNSVSAVLQTGGRNYAMPKNVLGCELWRDLDWLGEERKIALDVSGGNELAAEMMSKFVSQNSVKRYDLAATARRTANATFNQSHEGDAATGLVYAIDLKALVDGRAQSEADFAKDVIGEFENEVLKNLK